MDKDFHYYGTYVAACYAGYSAKDAQTIAHAAQYVDNSTNSRLINKEDYGIDFTLIPTTYTIEELGWTTVNSGPSISELHQVWIPFHFLPGNYRSQALPDPHYSLRIRKYTGPKNDSFFTRKWKYNEKAEWEFKLLCLPDSPIAIAMINNIINDPMEKSYKLHLIGVIMHVFADTAAHAYFAGTPAWHVNDAGAKVYDLTVDPKIEVPFQPTLGGEQTTPNTTVYYDSIFYLGHGRMGHIPDNPWIKYEYSPKWSSTPIIKDNPVEYLKIFGKMVTALKFIKEQRTFDINDLESIDQKNISAIDAILRTKHDFGLDNKAPEIRCELWKKAIADGSLGPLVSMPDEYDEDIWLDIVKQEKQPIIQTDYYKFNKAATVHLEFVKMYLGQDEILLEWPAD